MDTDPFESPKLLLARGKENSAEFEGRFRAFVKSTHLTIAHDLDPKTGNAIIKARLDKPFPGGLRPILSDAINNFRHALDQAVNSAAVEIRAGKRDCYFPFAADINDLGVLYVKRFKTVPVALRPFLDNLKPYAGGDDLLWSLGKISGPNKHQIILETATDVTQIVEVKAEIAGRWRRIYRWDSAKEEMTIAVAAPGTQFNLNIEMPILVKFGGSGPLSGHEAIGTLNALAGKADGILKGIEAETARIIRERS
jgi:hypothetical protein